MRIRSIFFKSADTPEPSAHARKFELAPSAILLPAIICLFNAWYFIALTIVAVAVHEFGHAVAVRLGGGTVLHIRISLTGVAMRYDGLSYVGDVLAALSGPAASIILAVLSALAGKLFALEAASHLAGLSMILGVFNLLPAYPLDGGRALFGAVAQIFGLRPAEYVRFVTLAAVMTAMLCGGVWLMLAAGNPTLIAAAIFLLCNASNMNLL